MGMFDKIKTGLEEAVAYERGTLRAKTTKLSVLPVDHYEADEIREIRKSTGFTQAVFAQYMGVSVKTVEAWEAGRNHPEGTACRLLALTQKDPAFPIKTVLYKAALWYSHLMSGHRHFHQWKRDSKAPEPLPG